MRFDHLGIIVSDLAAGRRLLESAVGVAQWTPEYEDPLQDVRAQFGRCSSGMVYETIMPRSKASPIARALKAKANALNHVAYLVSDLAREAERLTSGEFVALGPARPGIVFGNRPIQFFASPSRFILELIEAPDHRHDYRSLAEALV